MQPAGGRPHPGSTAAVQARGLGLVCQQFHQQCQKFHQQSYSALGAQQAACQLPHPLQESIGYMCCSNGTAPWCRDGIEPHRSQLEAEMAGDRQQPPHMLGDLGGRVKSYVLCYAEVCCSEVCCVVRAAVCPAGPA